ncbi:AMP-binding protein, partial [Roseiflexus sp.]|uniref:AMP-binding protein n=1 Tax=Roseiflexus sp. TaxID=2562120 RepID=UPI00398A9B7F
MTTTSTHDTTLPQLLMHNARRFGDKVALREKDFGIWQTITWRQFADHVRAFAMGLYALGVRRGDTVAIIGDNRPEWLYAEFAAQAIGAMSIGVYQDSVAKEVCDVVSAAEARVIVVEDQEQVDKIIELWPQLTGVLKVIYYESKGMRKYRQPYLASFPDIEELGRAYNAQRPGLFESELAAGRPDDVAILSTTSGTTGRPKLAMLTHRNLISQGASL